MPRTPLPLHLAIANYRRIPTPPPGKKSGTAHVYFFLVISNEFKTNLIFYFIFLYNSNCSKLIHLIDGNII